MCVVLTDEMSFDVEESSALSLARPWRLLRKKLQSVARTIKSNATSSLLKQCHPNVSNDEMSFESRIPSKAVHPELKTLLRVLEERDIPLNADDVAWAFESSKTKDSAASWVQEFLQPQTLLTKDELAL